MVVHSGPSSGTVDDATEASRSSNPRPRRASRLRSAAPNSSAVDSRTVAKRQCSTSSSSRKVPMCVCVLPMSTASSTGSDYARPVPAKLYVVHGSHPCATVGRALELKGIPYKTVELMPAMHAAHQRLRFGQRTVPGIKLEDGEKVVGSRAILQRLEELAPEPPLLPADPELRARVQDAERWGEEVFQPIARRLVWLGMRRHPPAIVAFGEHSTLPVPDVIARLSAPIISRVEGMLNDVSEEAVRADLEALPGHLDRI